MKKLLLLLAVCIPMMANTVITGSALTVPSGGVDVTGTLVLTPPTNVQLTRACGGSGGSYSPLTVTITVLTRALQTHPNMVGNDCLLPANTTYTATFTTSTGLVYTAQWYIFGASFNVNNQVFGGSGPIIGNPTSNQTISQPSGTMLYVNMMTALVTLGAPHQNGVPTGLCTDGALLVQDDAAAGAWWWVCAGTTWENVTGGGGSVTLPNTQIGTHFDGGGSAISGTKTTCQRVPYGGTIAGWYVISDVSGSATLGVKSVAFASYTGVSGYSGYTDVTGGGTAPTVTTSNKNSGTTLTNWVTAVTGGQVFCFQVSSVTSSTTIDVFLDVSHP